MLQSTVGGADAEPFVTYHNSLDRSFTLRIATELHLKRLIVGGFERVFELGRIFRNEGISTRHNPEFTSIELYQAYTDYNDMMHLTEDLVRECVTRVHKKLILTYGEKEIDFSQPFKRVKMTEAISEFCNLDLSAFSDLTQAKEAACVSLDREGRCSAVTRQKIMDAATMGHLMNEVFEAGVEDQLWQPTFVIDYPVEISPLAKPHRSEAGFVERFELFIAGRELANSFSELTDPLDQRKRLQKQLEEKQQSLQMTDGADLKSVSYQVHACVGISKAEI